MKTFKRNAVIITVVLFVCVAAYLNWSYNKNAAETEGLNEAPGEVMLQTDKPSEGQGTEQNGGTGTGSPDTGLFYTEQTSESEGNSDIFASTRISRRQARDSAAETLATVSGTEGASQEVIDAALEKISNIASVSNKEAELESLIMTKGFSDCIVFISDNGVKVTVPAPSEGLSLAAVAQITDVITTETEYRAADLEIIEVK